jgi:hypothetical protein
MLIGHYAPAFALKVARPRIPLWLLFVAVQLVDYGWATFVLIGVEHARITPGFTASNGLDLYDMPWTHGLAATGVWAVAGGLLGAMLLAKRGAGGAATAVILGVAIASHWFFDLPVHVGDLPLWSGDGPKAGWGLWQHRDAAFALELGLVMAAFGFYVWSSRPVAAPRAAWVAGLVLVVLTAASYYGPQPMVLPAMSATSWFLYTALAFGAAQLDARRSFVRA